MFGIAFAIENVLSPRTKFMLYIDTSESCKIMQLSNKYAWIIIICLLLCYLLGFFLYYPGVVTNGDETSYLLQAHNFAQGTIYSKFHNPLTGKISYSLPSHYPVGTSLLLTPFYMWGGLTTSVLFPLIMLVLTVLVTTKWLAEANRSPFFALCILGYPPSLVLGRVPLSDLPSAFFIACGYWFFWKGLRQNKNYWFISGLIAGLSLCFREPNVLLFVFPFLGALFRNEQKGYLLLLGGGVGVLARLLSATVVYGSPFFYKNPNIAFGFGSLGYNTLIYFIALMIFLPGGIIGMLKYRGERRTELLLTGSVFIIFYLCYQYSGKASGFVRSLVLGPRFFIPLLPVLCFQMAESFPRLWKKRIQVLIPHLADHILAFAISLWLIGVGIAAFSIHWGMYHYNDRHALTIRAELSSVISEKSVVIGNIMVLRKYLNNLYGDYQLIDFQNLTRENMASLIIHYPRVFIVFLDRAHSTFWATERQKEKKFLASLKIPAQTLVDKELRGGYHLLICTLKTFPGAGISKPLPFMLGHDHINFDRLGGQKLGLSYP